MVLESTIDHYSFSDKVGHNSIVNRKRKVPVNGPSYITVSGGIEKSFSTSITILGESEVDFSTHKSAIRSSVTST